MVIGQNFVGAVEFMESFQRVLLSEIWSFFGEFSKNYPVLSEEWSMERLSENVRRIYTNFKNSGHTEYTHTYYSARRIYYKGAQHMLLL